MPTARSIRTWSWIHKWTSLVCTVFMLLLCLTGLPLIFHHEIGHLLGTEVEAPRDAARGTPRAQPRRRAEGRPGTRIPSAWCSSFRRRRTTTASGSSRSTPTPEPTDDFRSVAVDARTGEVLAEPRFDEGFM